MYLAFCAYKEEEDERKRDWAKIGKNWFEHLLYGSKLLTTSAVYCVIKMDNVNVPLEPGANPMKICFVLKQAEVLLNPLTVCYVNLDLKYLFNLEWRIWPKYAFFSTYFFIGLAPGEKRS